METLSLYAIVIFVYMCSAQEETILSTNGSLFVEKDQNLNITCKINTNTHIGNIAFTKNGDKDSSASYDVFVAGGSTCYAENRVSCDHDKKEYTNILESTKYADGDWWTCSLNSINQSKNVTIVVTEQPTSEPSIAIVPQEPIIAGDNIKLKCSVTGGNPLATITWDCSGSTNEKTESTESEAVSSVNLNVSKNDNDKVCTCKASHILWSQEKTAVVALNVLYAPDTKPVVQQSPLGAIFNGTEVTLTCTAQGGNPLPILKWNCDGTSINNTSGNIASYSIVFTVDKNYNNKMCTCAATHPVTSYRPSVLHRLVVYYAPDTIPVITQSPSGPITSTIGGVTVTLSCSVSGGNPLAVLSWNCSGNNTNTTSGNTASYSVDFTVNKTYNNRICTCSGSHNVTSYRPTVHHIIVVYYAPDILPRIQQSPQGAILDGEMVQLTCSVSGGNPLAILSWSCNGSNTNNTSGDTASYDLKLTVNRYYNGKPCTCSATHPVESYRPVAHNVLVVYYAPDQRPVITQIPAEAIISGEKVTLTCLVSGGNPLAVLSWNCNGNKINTTSGNTASYSIEFTVNKTHNNRICTCSSSHPVPLYRPSVFQRLVVYYSPDNNPIIEQLPPDYVINGNNVTLKCYVSGGNPLATLTLNCSGNSINNTSGNTAVYSVQFFAYKDDNNKICTCEATHPVKSYNQVIQHELDVHYAPDVTVDALYSTYLEGDRLTLVCNATGNPPEYVYSGWTHRFGGIEIQTFETNKNNDTLILSSLSHQDIGNYRCSVKNGVPDLKGKLVQYSSRNIDVKFTPIVIDYGGITAKEGSNVSAKAGIFSFPEIDKRVKWMNESGNVLANGTHVTITFQAKPINITFRNDMVVSVENYTYETALHFTNFQRHLAGHYTLMVDNSIGRANLTLNVVLSDRPAAPTGFSAKVIGSFMVTLSWKRGFNGGNDQTFNISYRKQNTNEKMVLNKEEEKDLDYYEENIMNLIPLTTYNFTLTASNMEGPADAINNTLIITTVDQPESNEISITEPVVGAVGGTVTAVVIVIVVILLLRRYKGRDEDERKKLEPVKREDADEDELKDNILYVSAGPRLDNTQGATGVEYAVVKKGNKFSSKEENIVQETALYTEVNKKFKTVQTGDVYANVSNKGKKTGKAKLKSNTREDVYENMENKVGTAVTQQHGNKNKDGLLYADLVFNPTKSGAKYVIHGLEDRTIYADVDTTQKIDPLPDSDEEDSTETKTKP